MYKLLQELWPLHRTINADDIMTAYDLCNAYLKKNKIKIHKYKANSEVLSWIIPYRYKVNEAWLKIDGKKVADFNINPLHLLSYSVPKKIKGKLKDIKKHIWTSKKRPNAIPWEFKYYEKSWGFCVQENILKQFKDNSEVRGKIDVEFIDKPLEVGEVYIPGKSGKDIMFLTNICHPYQVNDSISGLVVALELFNRLANKKKNYYGLRLLIVPETIGSVAWFSKNEKKVKSIKYAFFCEMVGNKNSFILQKSKQGNSEIDKAFQLAMQKFTNKKLRTGAFREIVASDEIVSNGPGYDIPTPSITRWPYKEYHTSDDNPKIISEKKLEETVNLILEMWHIMNSSFYPKRSFKGPIMLSRYNLWVDWRENKTLNLKTEAIMLMLEGDKSIIDIAYELDLPYEIVLDYINKIYEAGLIKKIKK